MLNYEENINEMAQATAAIEALQAENERLKKQLEEVEHNYFLAFEEVEQQQKQLNAAERLISTMKNNKKAALWLRARYEKDGDTDG